jgi:hypothetical protein
MTSEQEQARLLAERIARRVSEGKSSVESGALRSESRTDVGEELAVVRASLEELQKRLARIESHITRQGDAPFQAGAGAESAERGSRQAQASASTMAVSNAVRSPWLSGVYVPATHPSQEKFGVEEAAVTELVDFFEGEKKCELEPGGKPCDHCAMCSTRGF